LNVLSVGIPSIQTIHGRNPEFLFRRLKDIYEIPLELLKTSFPHIFIELNVSWIRNVKKRRIIRIAELTNEGKIETLPEEKFEFFLSHPNSESGISTLDFLITHNENGLNEAMTLSKNIVLELSQDTTSGF
jgi:hypothetical protein